MKVFYQYAWNKRPKTCQCGCGKNLYSNFSTAMLDHTLEKREGAYPECMYSISNIGYYHPDCHAKKTNGFPTEKQKVKIEWCMENYDLLCEESSKFENKIRNIYG